MPNRHHLSAGNSVYVVDECRSVLSPLAPLVDMSAWAGTLAMTAQVDCEGGETEAGHPECESLVPSRVLAQSVHDRKGDRRTRFRPRPVRELGAVGRVYGAFAGERALSGQGDRGPSGS